MYINLHVAKWPFKSTSKDVTPSKTSWWPQRTRTSSNMKVDSFVGISVTEWGLIRSTGESGRIFEEDLRTILVCLPPMYDHTNITGHHTSMDYFIIVGRESHNCAKTTKDSIYKMGKWSIPQQKHWKVAAVAPMGCSAPQTSNSNGLLTLPLGPLCQMPTSQVGWGPHNAITFTVQR